MSASVVVGQSNFTSHVTGVTSANFANSTIRGFFVDPMGRLIVSDGIGSGGNNRVLIWNTVPTTNGKAADLVLGQPNFTSSTANNGGRFAQTLNSPVGVYSDGNKLYVLDGGNGRVLIWSTFPTVNQQAADVVVGQADMTGNSSTCNASTIGSAANGNIIGMYVYNNKLVVGDNVNRRVLIWNTVPTTNGVAADVVLGQPDMTTCSAPAISASSLNSPRGLNVDPNGKLFVADGSSANRVLIWNSIPTTNNTPANVVVGQPDLTSSATPVTASGLNIPIGVYSNGTRLFIGDNNNHRVLIYNSIPASNGASADIVLGQPNFTTATLEYGGMSASSMGNPQVIFEYQNKLFVSDAARDRILIFDNLIKQPGLTLNNSPEGRDNNQLRFSGTASVDTPYVLRSVEFSINGGSFSGAAATDGSFDETNEDYYFDFNPTSNQPRDSNGNLIDGYTVRVRSTNNNVDVTDRLFYFTPFDLLAPSDKATVSTAFPTFSFAVNRQRTNLRDNLSKYQVQVRKGDSDSTANWQTVVDDIPIDFSTVQTSDLNLQKNTYLNRDPNNGDGIYETTKFTANYSVDSSHVQVTSKISPLSGTYQWKIVAVDKAGHNQEAGARNLFVNATSTAVTNNFPIAVLNISGLGNPHINSYNPGGVKSTYYTSSSNPIFYGIAWTNSKVTLKLTDQSCKTDCTKTYTTTANAASRFGINVPKGDLKYGKKYTTNLSVAHEDKYNELPQFTLSISRPTSNTLGVNTSDPVIPTITPAILPTASPTLEPQPTPIPTPEKKCILFWCW